ncbi:MAG TPA: hypothetical protein PL182_03435 [Pseudobdellovibrionaceae bacterium]|nr:hypothetical protein [Pseudobdellovibrionaceae bacterium]
MKNVNLTQTQKKWALTATLLMVLGFNLSAPLKSGMQTLELASEGETKTQTIVSANGASEVEVQFVKSGDDKTIALVPYEFEGRSCESQDCMTTQVLNVPFESEARDLEKALRAKYATSGNPIRPAKEAPVDEESEQDAKLAKDQAILDRIATNCDRKEEGQAKASCLTKEFVKALKDKRKKIDKDLALEFFNDTIKPELLTALTSQEISSIALGGSVFGETSVRGAELLRKIQAEIPREYGDIRKAAKDVAVQVVNKYSMDAKNAAAEAKNKSDQAKQYGQLADQAMQQANQTQDWQQKMALQQQANQYRNLQNQLTQEAFKMNTNATSSMRSLETFLVNGLGQQQYQGLQDAYAAKLVDQSFASQLMTDFRSQAAIAIATPTTTDLNIPDILNPGTTPTLPGQGEKLPMGNGMGTIGGSVGGGTNNTFIGAPRSADQGFFRQ